MNAEGHRFKSPRHRQKYLIQFICVHLRLSAVALVVLIAPCAFAQREAQLPWADRAVERWIGPYWIKSDLPADQVNAIGRHLNFMHREYDRALGSVPVRVYDKLNVLLFATKDEWAFTLRTQYAIKPPEEGGYFMSHADQFLALWTDGLPTRTVHEIIQREGFRQFAYNRFGNDMPRWLHEGLAELFGEAVVVGDSLMFGRWTERAVTNVKASVNDGRYIPMATMLTITDEEWQQAQKELTPASPYRQAASMAMYALHPVHSELWARYVRHLNNGMPSHHAWARTFGSNDTTTERSWKQYVEAMSPSALATAIERAEFLAEGALELSRRKMYPKSLQELKDQLREIRFSMVKKMRHEELSWSADDEALFQIPRDELCVQQPVFIVGKSRISAARRDQTLEKDNPTPCAISTQHVRPTGVQVQWMRDSENKSFTYQILVR